MLGLVGVPLARRPIEISIGGRGDGVAVLYWNPAFPL